MLNHFQKRYRVYANLFLLTLVIFSAFFLVKFLLNFALPILISGLFYLSYKPFIQFLEHKLSHKLSVSISIFIVTLILGGIFFGVGFFLYFESLNAIEMNPNWYSWAQDTILYIFDWSKDRLNSIPQNYVNNIKEQLLSLLNGLSKWSYTAATNFISNITSLSVIIVQACLGYILSIFLAFEMESIRTFISSKFSDKYKRFYTNILLKSFKGIFGYLKAQGILILWTFFIVLIGLLILGINNAFVLAAVSGVLDILPLLGVPALFIPWIIYLFIFGSTNLAVKLTVLLLIVFLFRQIMEPRITGDSLGISPFLMLAGMLLFSSLFGVVGLFLSPVLLLLFKSLYAEGYFSNWIFDVPMKGKNID